MNKAPRRHSEWMECRVTPRVCVRVGTKRTFGPHPCLPCAIVIQIISKAPCVSQNLFPCSAVISYLVIIAVPTVSVSLHIREAHRISKITTVIDPLSTLSLPPPTKYRCNLRPPILPVLYNCGPFELLWVRMNGFSKRRNGVTRDGNT